MKKKLVIILLAVCCCHGWAWADEAQTNAVVQGNQGYIYGTPPKADDSAATATQNSTDNTPHPLGAIMNLIEKMDAWVRNNLW